jgi:hypothetical protein
LCAAAERQLYGQGRGDAIDPTAPVRDPDPKAGMIPNFMNWHNILLLTPMSAVD